MRLRESACVISPECRRSQALSQSRVRSCLCHPVRFEANTLPGAYRQMDGSATAAECAPPVWSSLARWLRFKGMVDALAAGGFAQVRGSRDRGWVCRSRVWVGIWATLTSLHMPACGIRHAICWTLLARSKCMPGEPAIDGAPWRCRCSGTRWTARSWRCSTHCWTKPSRRSMPATTAGIQSRWRASGSAGARHAAHPTCMPSAQHLPQMDRHITHSQQPNGFRHSVGSGVPAGIAPTLANADPTVMIRGLGAGLGLGLGLGLRLMSC